MAQIIAHLAAEVTVGLFAGAAANWAGERYGHQLVVFALTFAAALGVGAAMILTSPRLVPWIGMGLAIVVWIVVVVLMHRERPLRKRASEIWIRSAVMQINANTQQGVAAVVELGTSVSTTIDVDALSIGLIPVAGAQAMWLSTAEGDALIFRNNTITARPGHLRQQTFDAVAKEVAAFHAVQAVLVGADGHTIARNDGLAYQAKP